MKVTAATALTMVAEDVLVPVEPLDAARLRQGAHQAHEDDALGRAEVAAVDAGDQHSGHQRRRRATRPARSPRSRARLPGLQPRTEDDEEQPERR